MSPFHTANVQDDGAYHGRRGHTPKWAKMFEPYDEHSRRVYWAAYWKALKAHGR